MRDKPKNEYFSFKQKIRKKRFLKNKNKENFAIFKNQIEQTFKKHFFGSLLKARSKEESEKHSACTLRRRIYVKEKKKPKW